MTIRVLLIDDEPAHRLFAIRGIKQYSTEIEIIECSTATEAINYLTIKNLRENYFQIIVVDFKLDHENGLEVIKHVRKDDTKLPIVLVSTSDLWKYVLDCYKHGVNCYLAKGTEPNSYSKNLLSAISFLLR
jgi:DNA-binding NarL/FixJ family response regulator